MASLEDDVVPPHLRERDTPAPDYVQHPSKFSVDINHGGFFCGIGEDRAYVDGKNNFFDNCVKQTWCQDSIDMMLNMLGYDSSGLEHVYWLEPGFGMADGLRLISWERDAKKMVATADYCKTLRVCRSC
uniref:Uncharacterized protein n=1 Tax=Avena sativa TaxID=4498 RepID=A0ACD5XQ74_AVESA